MIRKYLNFNGQIWKAVAILDDKLNEYFHLCFFQF